MMFLIIFFLFFGNIRAEDKALSESINVVKNYINAVGRFNGKYSEEAKKYEHPDYFDGPGGDYLDYLIVSDNYKIIKTDKGKSSGIEEDAPKKVVNSVWVTVEFKELGEIKQNIGFEKIIKKYTKSYFCAEYNGEYLINDTDTNQDIVLYSNALDDFDAAYNSAPNPYGKEFWSTALIKLKTLKKFAQEKP